MKRCSILLWLLLAMPLAAQDWTVIKQPIKTTITGITFASPDTGFVVTMDGICGITTDGGNSWLTVPVGTDAHLEDVSFANQKVGYACARAGRIFRTNDAGLRWVEISLPDTTCWPLSICACSDMVVIVSAMSRDKDLLVRGVLWRTADAGKTWEKQPSLGMGYGELYSGPGKEVIFCSFGQLHRSSDMGKTWETSKSLDGKPARAIALSGKSGIMVGNLGMCATSSDAGKSWHSVNVAPIVITNLTSVVMKSPSVAIAAGTGSALYLTSDAGLTWTQQSLPANFDILDLAMVGNDIFAVGSNGTILKHSMH